MNDNKLSHKNTAVISKIIEPIKKYFGDFSIVRGGKHTFLGMSIEIKNSIIKIGMFENMRECMTMFGEYVSTPVSTPATQTLFEVREDTEQ